MGTAVSTSWADTLSEDLQSYVTQAYNEYASNAEAVFSTETTDVATTDNTLSIYADNSDNRFYFSDGTGTMEWTSPTYTSGMAYEPENPELPKITERMRKKSKQSGCLEDMFKKAYGV